MANLKKTQLKNKIRNYILETGKVSAAEVDELLQDIVDTLFYNIQNTSDPVPNNEFSVWSDSLVWNDNLVWTE